MGKVMIVKIEVSYFPTSMFAHTFSGEKVNPYLLYRPASIEKDVYDPPSATITLPSPHCILWFVNLQELSKCSADLQLITSAEPMWIDVDAGTRAKERNF